MTDGRFSLKFETGEYQKHEVLKVAALPDKKIYKVTVWVVHDGHDNKSEDELPTIQI